MVGVAMGVKSVLSSSSSSSAKLAFPSLPDLG